MQRLYVFVLVLFAALPGFAQSQRHERFTAPGLDGRWIELTRQVPGFGGYFFDQNGDLNVYLTDLLHEPAARAALAEVARTRPERSHQLWSRPAEIIVRHGQFDFAQLDRWRGRLTAALAVNGVHLLDSDEAANRIFIAVADEDTRQRVLTRIGTLGVPRDAVLVEIAPAPSLIATLRDSIRPLVGGLEIGFSAGVCTLGVNVWYTNWSQGIGVGTPGFYTCSHCSSTYGGTDGTVFSQGGARIGYERWDPPFFTNATNTRCPAGWNCRWSDVAFAQYDAGVNRHQGYIAHTYYAGSGVWNPGSIDIHPNQPERVLNQTSLPVVGNYLEKVGRTTGRTTGRVSRTCADYFIAGGYGLLCQDQVEAYADGGDSGSPVYQWTGQTTGAFAGIVWGKTGTGGLILSNLDRIQADMGNGVTYGPN
ncbi:MAG TPA: hypothetical protein VEO54_07125 [Thermoanaerobaculia bacterium]|nr:hypothetical protein [Thermoanaerobaculia bacterium]